VGSAGAASASYYGTFDQEGNVMEWNDAVANGIYRGLRGGGWFNNDIYLPSTFRTWNDTEGYQIGFRLASIPEPVVGLMMLLAGGVTLARRRR